MTAAHSSLANDKYGTMGASLNPNASIEEWQDASGLSWQAEEIELYRGDSNTPIQGSKGLVRNDTGEFLSIVSDRYQVVQPTEIMSFYNDLITKHDFQMHAAGTINGGRKIWALAKTGHEARIQGHDTLESYLLLATSFDRSLATVGRLTSLRMICQNQLNYMIRGDGADTKGSVSIPHTNTFDATQIHSELGFTGNSWEVFTENAEQLAERKVHHIEALNWLVNVFGDPELPVNEQVKGAKTIKDVYELYNGGAIGSNLQSTNGTAWGLMNATTEYLDHRRRSRDDDSRRNSAWFGNGSTIKQRAWNEAMRLAA